ncbi:MAG: GNAT family N-acetyltransferase [Castellaniella sp.]|uniref:bifunctional acetate--CoA ligase family protein/GNAT family N-acetyltransferase n=1 Tax=Castellaniella sp. TaxID=1955812 RepID=UPI00121F6442|nr:bifunctional acetate--CoA ligase family protein/GNAT family N-acetyltransferase [Castellaniella sp.]TAN30021.1 MAG: GNAT family N-acetyltransferase [Castellaniella sp.]
MTIRNLDYLFRPRSIAVIGATDRPHSVGSIVMLNLIRGGFGGPILPVNPKHERIAGLPAFHDLSALPTVPDLAIVCTPPATVPDLIKQLGHLGTKAAIVLTAGLEADCTGNGVDAQRAMLEAAQPHLLRILGPNCIGLIIPGLGLNASFAESTASPGKIAFVSQSGALTTAVLDWAAENTIGFSKFISIGNSADIDFGDILDYLASDPDTRSILLYIESIKHARKFMSAARAAARNKPVIVVKAGRSAAGAAAATSHTGAMAGSDIVFDAAIRRAGMLRVNTTQDLFSAIETLSRAKPLRGDKLIIMTNGGGPGVMAADALSLAGEELVALTDDTRRKLDAILPSTWSKANPIDIIGDAPVERYHETLSVLLGDGGSDSLLFMHAPTAIVQSEEIARECAPLIAASPRNTFGCWLGGLGVSAARQVFSRAGIPTYQTPEEAVQAFLYLLAYRRNQELLLETPPSRPVGLTVDTEQVRRIVEKALADQRSLLDEAEAKSVLAAYGIPVVETRVASTIEVAAVLAQQIGFPVALKILSPDITHKSDVGGVALNLESVEHVRIAARNMVSQVSQSRPDARLTGFTVQAMINRPDAHELILGMAEDQTFGPIVLFGQGGVATQVINDRSVSLPPLNMALAEDLAARTRVFKLLQGYRNHPAADLPNLYRTMVALSQLIVDIPEMVELDINPLLLDENGVMALDARIRVAPSLLQGTDRLAIRPYPKELEEMLEHGTGPLLLRPILPSDARSYQFFLQTLNAEDAHNRFFCAVRQLAQSELARVTQIDYSREMTLVAVSQGGSESEVIVGEVRLIFDPDNQQAEVGLAVSSALKSSGLGSKLLSKAIRYCRERDTACMVGTVLVDNFRMLGLARKFGFALSAPRDGLIDIHLKLNTDRCT